MKERIILGIDPGTNLMGYGIIKTTDNKPVLLTMDVINLSKKTNPFDKLKIIFDTTTCLIKQYKVTEFAIEAPFYGKNIQSMLKLGRAQGVAISAALSCDIAVFEYAPRKIKMSVTGQGSASKEQVAGMLQRILKFQNIPEKLDATDGLAAAVCHFYQNRLTDNSTRVNSWKEFLTKNPQRIK